jgi:hypothetical protein
VDHTDFDEQLSRQLELTQATWKELQSHGVTEATELHLDFFYDDAPSREAAVALVSFLQAETDYDVVTDDSEGSWRVSGTTQGTTVSAEILEQWVEWMFVAGVQHAGCGFDGWGAQVP